MTKTFEGEGWIYRGGADGRYLVIDAAHASTADHLRAPADPGGADKLRCRRYVDDVFEGIAGKRGRLRITFEFEEHCQEGSPASQVTTSDAAQGDGQGIA